MTKNGRSRLRDQAILGLLSHSTIRDAANFAGISMRTLLRWLKDATFQESFRAAKNELLARATTQLRNEAGKAVAVLAAVANDGNEPAAARVTAARTILELSLRAHQIEEIETRIRILEEQGNAANRD